MIRRTLLALTALAFVGGCTTFSSAGAAARLGDAELSVDQLEADLAEAGATPVDEQLDAEAARGAIERWFVTELGEGSGFLDQYAAGDGPLGVSCFAVAVAPDLATAESFADRLASGESWDALVAEVQPDAVDGGRRPCDSLSNFSDTERGLLEGLAADGTPTLYEDPNAQGALVLRALAPDEVDVASLFAAAVRANPDQTDALLTPLRDEAWVNPRFGAIDPATLGVVPLG